MYLYKRNIYNILLTKTTAAQNEVALSYHTERGLFFLTVFFAAAIVLLSYDTNFYRSRNKFVQTLSSARTGDNKGR